MADIDQLFGRTLGEFVLRERLDEGGFGSVYRCEQPLLGREAVVKVLQQRLRRRDLAVRRFMREAKLASRLDHPYAAHVYAFGVESDGLVWIAMELVHGITLSRWLQTRGPLPLDQFVPFFERVAEVVQAAHDSGIVHRDLKPSNIMIIERAGALIPKLLDFGVAKLHGDVALRVPHELDDTLGADEDAPAPDPESTVPLRMRPGETSSARAPYRLTPASATLGTPPYMAPELWNDSVSVGPSADLYSLGVIAYESLTGKRPFRAETVEEFGDLHRHAAVPPIEGDLLSLDALFQKALAKSPENRYGNALDLAAALRAEMEARMLARVRAAARQWREAGKPNALLWRDDVLADLERWMERSTRAGTLTGVELEFADASRERETDAREASLRRRAWFVRGTVALSAALAASVLGIFHYRTALRAEMAEELAARSAITAEVEQGRQALLHDDMPEAQLHLAEAYKRGDHSPATSFMLARALQPLRAVQARFAASSGRMWFAGFSPDGSRVVTTDDTAALVWDARTNQLLRTLPHGDEVRHAVYSSHGELLYTACSDGAVRIWDAESGVLRRELRQEHLDGKSAHYFLLALSRNDKLVAAIDTMGAVADVWDAVTGAPLASLANDGSDWPGLAFSADSRSLATTGGDDVRVFDTTSWARTLTIPGPRVRGLSFDPTAPHLLTGTADGDVSIWSLPTGARIHHLREVGDTVDAVAYAPNGELVVAASRSGDLQVFDARSGKLKSQTNQLHGKIMSVAFDARSHFIVAGGGSGTVVVADAELGLPVTVLAGPRNVVRAASFDPSSRSVIAASWDGTAHIWDATSPYRRWRSPPIGGDCGIVTSLKPDQRFVAAGCRDQLTRIWDTAHDQLVAELPSVTPPGGDFAPTFPAVSADGTRAAIARGTTVQIYELPRARLLRVVTHRAAVSTAAFGGTGHDIVSGAVDGSLLVTRDDRDPQALPDSPGGIDVAGFLPDGRVVSVDMRGRLRVYASDGSAVRLDLAAPGRVGLLRPSPDGHSLVTVPIYTAATAPVLWDLSAGRITAQLEGHVGRVFSARWVANDRIVTAGGDGAVMMWDSATGRVRQTYRGASRVLFDATLDPSGMFVVAGGSDGLLRFWDAASGRPLWTTLAHKSALIALHFEGGGLVTRGFDGDISRWTLPPADHVIRTAAVMARP